MGTKAIRIKIINLVMLTPSIIGPVLIQAAVAAIMPGIRVPIRAIITMVVIKVAAPIGVAAGNGQKKKKK